LLPSEVHSGAFAFGQFTLGQLEVLFVILDCNSASSTSLCGSNQATTPSEWINQEVASIGRVLDKQFKQGGRLLMWMDKVRRAQLGHMKDVIPPNI
jgi:hypothetical protein